MSKDYDKLKAIGAQKIHEMTHIPRLHVEAILGKIYEDMTKIQFFGFISILEREYYLDLNELRKESLVYYNELALKNDDVSNVLLSSKQKSSKAFSYILVSVSIFVGVVYFSLSSSSQKNVEVQDIDESLIVSAQVNMQIMKNEEETQVIVEEKEQKILVPEIKKDIVEEKEQKILVPEIKKDIVEKKEIEIKSFFIQPKENLWLGYKDLDTGKSYQITTPEELQLDSNKTWLLTCGHGNLNIIIDGNMTKYNDSKIIRFLYKDGVMNKINYKKFKELNAGGKW